MNPIFEPRGLSPGLFRRLAAILYDSLLLFAVLFFATVPVLFLTGGKAVPPHGALNTVYTAYLLGVSFFFFAWLWTHGGQTLGMRAWRMRVQRPDGGAVTWDRALVRFLGALLSWLPIGAGYLWILVDRDHKAWHDRLSGTVVVILNDGRKHESACV